MLVLRSVFKDVHNGMGLCCRLPQDLITGIQSQPSSRRIDARIDAECPGRES